MTLPEGIRKRGQNYLVDVTVGGVRKTCTRPTVEQAVLAQAELRAAMLKTVGAQVEHKETWTMQQALDKTSALAWQGKPSSEDLIRNGEACVRFFGPALPLTKLTADQIDEFVESLQESGNSNGTVNRKLAALSKMLTVAQQRGKLEQKPHIQRQDEAQHRIRFLTREEELTSLSILDQWGKDEHSEVFCVLIDTGMRESELWRVEARDFDERLINIWMTKNQKPRSIPMTSRVGDILRRRASIYPRGPLFPFDNNWFGHTWDKMKAHMGLQQDEQFVPYALRHTCISRLVQRGVPLKVVQEWAGHKIITTTMRYAHLCPSNLLDAVKVLEAV